MSTPDTSHNTLGNTTDYHPLPPSWLRNTATTLKVLLGLMFLFSAATKFISIETFELYLFSFHILPLTLCSILARLAIGVELLLGLWLISGRWHRWACYVTLLMLLFFTLFLGYVLLIGRSDSCNCFGELLPLTPAQSILKNALIIPLVLIVWKWGLPEWHCQWWMASLLVLLPAILLIVLALYGKASMRVIDAQFLAILFAILAIEALIFSFHWSQRWWIVLLLALTPIATIFIQVPPSGWFHLNEGEHFDRTLYQSSFPSSSTIGGPAPTQHRQVVAFFSAGCTYCLHTAQMLSSVQQRHNLDTAAFLYVFPDRQVSNIDKFYATAQSPKYRQTTIPINDWIGIVQGQFPVVALVDHDTIHQIYPYGTLSESIIVQFLNPTQS